MKYLMKFHDFDKNGGGAQKCYELVLVGAPWEM